MCAGFMSSGVRSGCCCVLFSKEGVAAETSVGGCDLLAGCALGGAEENDGTKQVTGQTEDSGL